MENRMMATSTTSIPSVAFAGGGTGGHIYPGLAIIGALNEACAAPPRVFWIGSKTGADGGITKSFNVQFFGIHSGKLRRYVSLKNLSDIFKIIAGFFQSLVILKKQKPCLLFSKGGFVSVPPVIAAYILGIPVWTHESDFSPGLATKINGIFAQKIYTSFPDTLKFFNKKMRKKITTAGNPVRSAFYQADAARGRRFAGAPDGEPLLLVLGGSQGAREINALVRASLNELCSRFVVFHQTGGFLAEAPDSGGTGAKNEATGGQCIENQYIAKGRYVQVSYIKDELPDLLAAAALVVGRSGAGTVWECAAAGKPMVLVPLSGSGTRGDQVENARWFAEKAAAVCLIRPDKAALTAAIDSLTDSSLAAMREASGKIGRVNAAQTIAADIKLRNEKGEMRNEK
jgi:UDP-N-acetylglucosamine--N-acetylmuramyl-(pentapeptide) pyrophosphoryl-undecaprenol N-acetylglucosamine transferase